MRRLVLVLPCLLFVSCATMISGRDETLTIDSEPRAASARLICEDGTTREGVTPMTTTIRRKAGVCNLTVSKDGYATQTLTLEDGVNPMYWVNFVTAPLGMCTVIGFNGFFFSEPDTESRMVGLGCLAVAASGWLYDRKTGAVWKHVPNRVTVKLETAE